LSPSTIEFLEIDHGHWDRNRGARDFGELVVEGGKHGVDDVAAGMGQVISVVFLESAEVRWRAAV